MLCSDYGIAEGSDDKANCKGQRAGRVQKDRDLVGAVPAGFD